MSKSAIPLIFLVSSLIQALLTAPLSKLSGMSVRNRNLLLLAGFAVMIGCNASFALLSSEFGECARAFWNQPLRCVGTR